MPKLNSITIDKESVEPGNGIRRKFRLGQSPVDIMPGSYSVEVSGVAQTNGVSLSNDPRGSYVEFLAPPAAGQAIKVSYTIRRTAQTDELSKPVEGLTKIYRLNSYPVDTAQGRYTVGIARGIDGATVSITMTDNKPVATLKLSKALAPDAKIRLEFGEGDQ